MLTTAIGVTQLVINVIAGLLIRLGDTIWSPGLCIPDWSTGTSVHFTADFHLVLSQSFFFFLKIFFGAFAFIDRTAVE